MAGSSIFEYIHSHDHKELAEQLGLNQPKPGSSFYAPLGSDSSDEGSSTPNPPRSSTPSLSERGQHAHWPTCTPRRSLNLHELHDRQKVEGFLRRSTRARFCCKNLPNFSDICLEADQNLFRKVLRNPQHVLHQLLPPVSDSSHSYSLRTRSHNRQLPDR